MLNKQSKHVVNATNLARLNISDSERSLSVVRIHNRHMTHFKRWMPVCITNKDNDLWVIRYVIGSNAMKGLTMHSLGLDYDAQSELKIKDKNNVNLTLKKATLWQIQMWMCLTPDIHTRYGNYWGILGTVLGIIGIIGMF